MLGFAEKRDGKVFNTAVRFSPPGGGVSFNRQVPETARLLVPRSADTIFVPAWAGYGEMNDLMMRVRACKNGVDRAFVHPHRALLIDSAGGRPDRDAPQGSERQADFAK